MRLTAKERRLIRFALERLALAHEEFAFSGGPRPPALDRAAEARDLIDRLDDAADAADADGAEGTESSLDGSAFAEQILRFADRPL
ncbi:MAG TPA: hypothetical protein VGG33_10170 [Polyangia bacterium]